MTGDRAVARGATRDGAASRARPVGVLDWGIGGLGVVRALSEHGVLRPVLYVSDSGTAPYGLQSRSQLQRRLRRWKRWFAARGCAEVLIGCNAASTALDAGISEGADGSPQLRGIIEPTVREVLRLGLDEVVVIGGTRTVESGSYPERCAALGGRTRWRGVVAQPLSALVESGEVAGAQVEEAVAAVAAQVGPTPALISGCTHYQALRPVLERHLPWVQMWLEPAAIMVDTLMIRTRLDEVRALPPRRSYFTTGDAEQMVRSACAGFGIEIGAPPVELDVETLRPR